MSLKSFSNEELKEIPNRLHADKSHEEMGEGPSRGCHPNSEAIGGFYGICWYSVFKDETGKLYKVYCSDGVYGGMGPYKETSSGS